MHPQAVTLLPNSSQQFTQANAASWIVSPSLGSITNAGLYTAPRVLWLSRVVTVSALDANSNEAGQATVTVSSVRGWMTLLSVFWAALSVGLIIGVLKIWPPPASPQSLSVYPLVATLQAGDTLQFLSSATRSGDTAVIWSASEGDITPSGVFSVPAKPQNRTIVVTATRNSDHTQTASAQVIVAGTRLVMDRSVVDVSTMKDGEKVPFQARGAKYPQNGLHWYLSGAGDIDTTNGEYTVRDKSASQSVVTAVDPAGPGRAAGVVQLSAPGAVDDESMLLLVVLMGALGALLAAIRSFVNFVGSRTFVPSWSFYYLFRPVFGAGLALIVFFAYRIGAFTGPKGGSPADPFTTAFVAGMVGLFADTVLQKLKELIEQLFRPQDSRTDKLAGPSAASAPTITRMTVDHGTLTITGTGFAPDVSVSVNGAVEHATFVDPTKLTVALAGHPAGTPIAVFVTNAEGKSSATMTITI